MKRVAIYARYSSDRQKPVSIDDQLRDCRAYAAREGWTVVAEHTDPVWSGRTYRTRPGLQALVRDAVNGECDTVLAFDLDRISRDLADPAIFFKKMRFARVDIVTIADGVLGPMHIGMKGTMNAMERDKIVFHTRRGLRGRIAKGRSAGGCAYGYRVVRDGPLVPDPKTGDLVHERGLREIDPEQAAVVQRIFRDFAAGISPKAIAIALNREGVPSPGARYRYRSRGPTPWSPSTIHGHARRGTGILNNELYIGRRVWNRHQFDFDPDSERRVARLHDQSEWVVKDEPHLRIIEPELWAAAKARQERTLQRIAAFARTEQKGSGIGAVRRPIYVFSGLTKCQACGGSYCVWHRTTLRCYNHARGTCSNARTIRLAELEGRVFTALETKFFQGDAFDAFCESFVSEVNRLRREHRVKQAEAPRELARINRRSKDIMELLLNGFRDEAWKLELQQIEQRRAQLEATIEATAAEPPAPALHPQMAAVFAQKVRQLRAALNQDDPLLREPARDALRNFVDRIDIPSDPSALLTVRGVMGEMLQAAAGPEGSAAVAQLVTLVGEKVGCGGGI
ncbi:MAG TPA: recombinase family protein [Vicinamibacterales bacterium]|nr:recombinase family protein [Vicinamibacterales bacterium]